MSITKIYYTIIAPTIVGTLTFMYGLVIGEKTNNPFLGAIIIFISIFIVISMAIKLESQMPY